MMKLINTFKGGLLKLGVMFELFKMGVLKSDPVKAVVYVWGLGLVNRLFLVLSLVVISYSVWDGHWINTILSINISYMAISAMYYGSKYLKLSAKLEDLINSSTSIVLKGELLDAYGEIPVRNDTEEVEGCSDDDNLLGDYLRSITQKREDGSYFINVDEDLVNNTNKDE